MSDKINFEYYSLMKIKDGTYRATVYPDAKQPDDIMFFPADPGTPADIDPKEGERWLVIPEEYEGTPITEIKVSGYKSGAVCTICVSKNVRSFNNDIDLYQDNLPYFVKVSKENPWLCADDKAVFSKDKRILYAFTARRDDSYTIPDEVRVIHANSFSAAYCLEHLTFPEELDEIRDMAFHFCGIRDWKLPKKVKKIESWGLAGIYRAETFVLPEEVEEMAWDAFGWSQCSSPVYLPDCYARPDFCIPNHIFAPEYIIDENSTAFAILDGVVYTKDMKVLLAVPRNAPSVITVPDGVEVIGSYSCEVNKRIKEMILPKSVHTISSKAFDQSSIERINLDNVRFIDDEAFFQCSKLKYTGNIGAERINRCAFSDCENLASVILTNIGELGKNAFSRVKSGAELSLPEGLEMIGENALHCSFRSVRIPRSASKSENFEMDYWTDIELYDVEDSVIYKKDPKINNFSSGSLIKVLSPDTDEIMYAVKIFAAEETDAVKDSREYISSLFGGEQFFDLKQYDEYFRTVYNRNHIRSKYEAAYYRMKYPAEITDYTREMYMTYLEVCSAEIVWYILNKRSAAVEEIADFPYLYAVEEKYLIDIITHSAENGLTEITSFLMNYKNEHFPEKAE